MKISYIVVILVIALVARAILVETPEGREYDFKQLPQVGKEFVRFLESITRGVFNIVSKIVVKTRSLVETWLEDFRAKRHEQNGGGNEEWWSAVSVTDPDLIKECVEIWGPHPEGPRKLGDWRSELGCSVAEANAWRSLSPDLPRLVVWKRHGMSPDDTAGWLSNRSITPEEAKNWHDRGFSAEIASSWRNRGYEPEEAYQQSYGATLSLPDARALDERCEACGINPQSLQIEPWVNAGFVGTQLVLIPLWLSLGFNPVEAKLWKLPPTTSADWRKRGFTASEAENWTSTLSTLTASMALQWKSAGFTAAEFAVWKNSELEFAVTWRAVGVSSESEASMWIETGFSQSEAHDWKSNGVSSPEVSRSWKDKGFSPSVSSRWIRDGVSPERAEIWVSHGYTEPGSVATVNKNKMVSDADLLHFLEKGMNPAEIEGEIDKSRGEIGLGGSSAP